MSSHPAAQPGRQFAIRRAVSITARNLNANPTLTASATKYALDRYEKKGDSAFRSIRHGEDFLLAALKRA